MDDYEIERIKMRKMREYMKREAFSKNAEMDQPSEPVEVNDGNFDDFVSQYPLVVIDFWAEWCAPCRAIAPVIEDLAKQLAGKVVFGKLNVDLNPATAARFGVMSIPTLMIFKNGQAVDSIIGAVPKAHIQSRIMRYVE